MKARHAPLGDPGTQAQKPRADFPRLFDGVMKKGGNRDLSLRELIVRLRKEGQEKPVLEQALIDYLPALGTDEDEDVIRDVLDYLAGVCSPHLRID